MKFKNNFCYFFFSLFSIVSCNFINKPSYNHQIIQTDSIVLNKSNNLPFIQFDINEDTFIQYSDENILLYKLPQFKIIKTYKLNLLKGLENHYELIYKNNQIYSSVNLKNEINVLDTNGKIVKNYKLKDKKLNIYHFISNIKNNKIAIVTPSSYQMFDSNERILYYKSSLASVFSLQPNGSLLFEDTICKAPKDYIKHDVVEYWPIITDMVNDTIAYMFSNEPSIFLYCNHSTIQKNIKGLPRNNLSSVNIDSEKIFYNYHDIFNIQNEKYRKLVYDAKNKRFFLIQSQAIKFEEKMGIMPIFTDKPFSIFVIDSDYQIIARKQFEKIGNYDLSVTFIFDGILYLTSCPKSKNEITIIKYEVH